MLRLFDDWKSLVHFFLGLISSLNPILFAIILPAFTLYQLMEKEPMKNKIGDFVEFFAGLALGAAIHSIYCIYCAPR